MSQNCDFSSVYSSSSPRGDLPTHLENKNWFFHSWVTTLFLLLSLLLSLVYTSAPNGSRIVCEPNACMCGWDCEPMLCHLRTVCILFVTNRNLSVFCANIKRTGCAGCPFHAPNVLCSPQVRGKLITCVPLTYRTRTAQRVSGALMYIKLYCSKCDVNRPGGGGVNQQKFTTLNRGQHYLKFCAKKSIDFWTTNYLSLGAGSHIRNVTCKHIRGLCCLGWYASTK